MVRLLGSESRKAHSRRQQTNFYSRFLQGKGLDIGFRGLNDTGSGQEAIVPITDQAIGIDLDYPGYDGKHLPFSQGEMDFVYSSHCLEHVPNTVQALQEWFRVLKDGGHLIITVPHQFLYEKRRVPPSRFSNEHLRFYTPAKLLLEIENALSPNSYRVVQLNDCDTGFDYSLPESKHSCGEYQIELIIQKRALTSSTSLNGPWELADYFSGFDLENVGLSKFITRNAFRLSTGVNQLFFKVTDGIKALLPFSVRDTIQKLLKGNSTTAMSSEP